MKPYFAKYLPVEGEIKEGDSLFITTLKDYKDNTGYRTFIQEASTILLENISNSKVMNPQKAKLFLCSRDIQVGDMVQEISYDGTLSKVYSFGKLPNINDLAILYDGKLHHQTRIENIIKVIGEISPEATWVKEGDEFDEEEIMVSWQTADGEELDRSYLSETKCISEFDKILVLGPCKHFH